MEQPSPLISILIPTYNRPKYFRLALESALRQTYKNIEIIVTDDSTNDETYNLIQTYLHSYPFIKYYRNPNNLGGVLNFIKAYELCNGEYINFLMDDDLFHPKKIEKMLQFFLMDTKKEITLVTSYRSFIDEQGKIIPDSIYNKSMFPTTTIVDGIQAGSTAISTFNWIGEPTTALFRKDDLLEPFGTFCGRLYRSGVDIAAWLTLLSKGNIVYIPEPLSYLRLHLNNISKSHNMRLHAAQDWIHMLFHGRKHGFLKNEIEFQGAVKSIQNFLAYVITLPLTEVQSQEIRYYSRLLQNLEESTSM